MKSFAGKVAAITGAASGMGRELALELARRGCEVAVCDVNGKGLEETVAAARQTGVRVTSAHVDVSQRDAVFAWADQVVKDHGRANLIFNNAGVALSAALDTVSQADFEWIMGINFWGVVHGTQAFLPYLKAAGDGHIVNTSSLFGLIGVPGVGTYCASKFAVRGFTESLRIELDMLNVGVSATCVHPGGIRTNINMAARTSNNVEELFGKSAEELRDRFDKLLNTTSAAKAARVILDGVAKNKRRVLIGPDAVMGDLLARLLGSGYQRHLGKSSRKMLGGKR
jgi:NAD(P)-dependent dehydrogenase (short-subunit alcohol dehydrogenase family)